MLEHPIEIELAERSPASAQTEMTEALVAGEGLGRVAEIAEAHLGQPVGLFVPRPGSDGADGSPAERYVAALVAGEDPVQPREIGEVAPIVSRGVMLGAVVMLGAPDPAAREYLEAAAAAALTGIAVMNALDAVGARSRGSLLRDLLVGTDLGDGEILRRARRQGCDLSGSCVALCVETAEPELDRVEAVIAAERPEALIERVGGRVYALLPGTEPEEARRLTERLAARSLPALSSRHRGAAGARLALEEAGLLVEMARAGELERADEPTWDPIRLLFRAFRADPEEVAAFSERTIGAAVRHDEEHGSELQATFWAYQRSNCNMNETAKRIFTHRHTVANRLARIEELTGLDPVNGLERELICLALKAHYVATMAPVIE